MLQFTSSKSYQVRNGFSFAALTSTGAVLYWAGDGTMAVQSAVPSGATAAAVNRHAVAALTSSGDVRAAGIAGYIRGYEAYQSGGADLVAIVGNEGAFAGITTAGGVVVFGGLGNGNNLSDSGFTAQLASGVIAVVAAAASFTALKADGTVFTWGNKYCGGGVSSLTRTDLQDIVKVFATRTAFAGLTATGKVLTWGDRNDGGDSSAVSARLQSDVFHIVSTESVFVAMKIDQSVVLWGNPWFGGDASTAAAQLAADVTFVAHSTAAFAALREDGSVVTWGKAASGGDSSAAQPHLVGVKTIVSNFYAFTAITTQGTVVAWGDLAEGGEISADVQTALSAGVIEVFSTNRAFAALKGATGELVLWGNPYHGGDAGAAAAYLSSGVRTVCGNDAAFTAFLQDGRAVAWGHGTSVPQPGLLNLGNPMLIGAETAVCL
jgi:hypothetical protein